MHKLTEFELSKSRITTETKALDQKESDTKLYSVVLGGGMVIDLAIGPKFRRFKPG
jgi:hypothetical protein